MVRPNRDERRKSKREAYQLAQEAKTHIASLPAIQGSPTGRSEEGGAVPPTQIPLAATASYAAISELLGAFWHWVGGRWQWGPLFAGACTMIKLGEYGVGWFLFALTAFAVSSKISHWQGLEGNLVRTKRVITFGYCLVGVALVFLTIVTFSVKGRSEERRV